MSDGNTLLLGQMIRGRMIHDVLGQGGMGAVYRVESAKPPSPHVLKEMRPKAADPNTPEISTADLYANEVRVMAKTKRIDQTSQLLAAFEEEGIWFIAMTLLSGKTLDDQIATKQLIKHDGEKFVESEVHDIQAVGKLDDSVFGKP